MTGENLRNYTQIHLIDFQVVFDSKKLIGFWYLLWSLFIFYCSLQILEFFAYVFIMKSNMVVDQENRQKSKNISTSYITTVIFILIYFRAT